MSNINWLSLEELREMLPPPVIMGCMEYLNGTKFEADNIGAMRNRITSYFANVTEAQLKEDLERAGYEFYKNVDVSILDKEATV